MRRRRSAAPSLLGLSPLVRPLPLIAERHNARLISPPDRHGPFHGAPGMSDRTNTLLWMRDLIEHMRHCQEQLQWASDDPSESFLTEACWST